MRFVRSAERRLLLWLLKRQDLEIPVGRRAKELAPDQKAYLYTRRSKDLLVDFDGTLSQWAYPDIGEPTQGAARAMRMLRDRGYRIVIWTARMDGSVYSLTERIKTLYMLQDWLERYNIEYDEIDMYQAGKRVAGAYIDDKAIRFGGNWDKVLLTLTEHEVLEQARITRTREVYGVDSRSGPGFDRDRPIPGGWEWEAEGGCNDKS